MRNSVRKCLLATSCFVAFVQSCLVQAEDAATLIGSAYTAIRAGDLDQAEMLAKRTSELLQGSKDPVPLARVHMLSADIRKLRAAGIAGADTRRRDGEFDKVVISPGPAEATASLEVAERILLDAVPLQEGTGRGFALINIHYQLTQVYARKPDKQGVCRSYVNLLDASELVERDHPGTGISLFGRPATPQQFRSFWRAQSERVGCPSLN